MYIFQQLKWMLVNRIKKIRPLYYIDYNKESTKQFLTEKFGWEWYSGHHMENKTSYFANNYYLPKKFDIDLRISEYAALVRDGQMLRENALEKLSYPSWLNSQRDMELLSELLEMWNLTSDQLSDIMKRPAKFYWDYGTYKKTFELMKPFFWLMYKMNLSSKSFYLKYAKKIRI